MRAAVLLVLIGAGLAGAKAPAYTSFVHATASSVGPSPVGPSFSSGTGALSVGSSFSSGMGPSPVGPSFSSGAATATRHVDEYWPNGILRRSVDYLGDVRHGEYRTWTIDGKPYEFKHFVEGREDGLQQAWDPDGKLYLNYVVKNGRRYGMVNAKPCLPPAADGTSQR